ncbi:Bifunctional protein GlmU [Geranomyces michiganensis]|nr:Bifunctional protein GlmU [Geranomyces michiganensis]
MTRAHPHPAPLLASSLSKRRGERFFLVYSLAWVLLIAVIVQKRLYLSFDANCYLLLGLVIFLPAPLVPIFLPALCDDPSVPFRRRYTTKANIWIAVYSFIANYVFTHYFYQVLHVSYTFPAHRLNDVPFALYLVTHGYFILYHVVATLAARLLWRVVLSNRASKTNYVIAGAVLLTGSILTAFLETWTIKSFPYYTYPDQRAMLTTGSVFYAIYFVISFPCFARIDEAPGVVWTVTETVKDVLAASMAITLLLDAWRLALGPLVLPADSNSHNATYVSVAALEAAGMPWMRR